MDSHSAYKEFLDNDNPADDLLHIWYTYLLFIQVYSILLCRLRWLPDLDYGQNRSEHLRRRKPLDKKIGSKLSNYLWVEG